MARREPGTGGGGGGGDNMAIVDGQGRYECTLSHQERKCDPPALNTQNLLTSSSVFYRKDAHWYFCSCTSGEPRHSEPQNCSAFLTMCDGPSTADFLNSYRHCCSVRVESGTL
jgi:hypothetical protein